MKQKTGKGLLPVVILLFAAVFLTRKRRTTRHGRLKRIFVEGEEAVTTRIREGRFSRILAAHVTFNLHDNDKKLIEFAKDVTMDVLRASGASEVVRESHFAHLVGGARMGKDPAKSVVDAFGRTHNTANLFVCDGSVMPTQGSANPGLTIQALAARTADYLISQGELISGSDRRDMTPPPIRRQLSPPGTHGPGIPRLR